MAQAPEPPATPAGAPAPEGPRAPLEGLPVLRLLWPLGALGLLATLVGRLLAPAVEGVAVGIGPLVSGLGDAGAILTQLFALTAVASAAALVSVVAQARGAYALRALAVIAGVLSVLVVINAAGRQDKLPNLYSGLIGLGAAALAITAARDGWRAPFARPAALVVGLVGAGALARLVAAIVADRAASAAGAKVGLSSVASGVATAAFAFDALAVLVATLALAPRRLEAGGGAPRDGGPPERAAQPGLLSPLILVAFGLAFVAARQAVVGGGEDARAADVLLRRMLERLLSMPLPAVPLGVQLFFGALSMVVAALSLAARRGTPALAGVVALALVARGGADTPLGAIALALSALGLALASRDARGLWAALLAGSGRERADGARAPAGEGGAEGAAKAGNAATTPVPVDAEERR